MRIDLPNPQAFGNQLSEITEQVITTDITGIATDSREVIPGDMFVAIKGERVDGHNFLNQVIEQGASLCLIEDKSAQIPNERCIITDDTVKTLGYIASEWRKQFSIPVIGITGSNGKTTTKELLRHLLSVKHQVHATEGNFNTSIGLPLSMLTLTSAHTISVLEMGANQPGDIAYLCGIAKPTHGLITNIAPAHLEGFGSIDTIAMEKGQLFLALTDGIAFVNVSDARVLDLPTYGNKIRYGFTPDCDFSADTIIEDDETITLKVNTHDIPTGSRNLSLAKNVLAALTIGINLELDWNTLTRRVKSFSPSSGRCVVSQWQDVTIIDDTYNANLESTKAAIDFLAEYKNRKRIFVFGDMLELGNDSADLHAAVGHYCTEKKLDMVYTTGDWTAYTHNAINNSINKVHFDTKNEMSESLRSLITPGDVILFKGSRGMAMETIIEDVVKL